MNRLLIFAGATLFLCSSALQAQAPAAPAMEQSAQAAALLKEIQAQQAEMAANQVKIDEKLAALSEIVRQARIYASRGGK